MLVLNTNQSIILVNNMIYTGVSKWAGTFTRLRLCIVPVEITEHPPPPKKKISDGQNHRYDWLVEYFS